MQQLKKRIAAVLAVTLLITLSGCSDPAKGSDAAADNKTPQVVKIATKPMTEQYILGEMLGLLIKNDTDYTVEITKGIGGGTSNIQPAMVKGDFDLYPEYTSSGWIMVLEHESKGLTDDEVFQKLKQEYEEKFGMTWLGLYGFNNTYTVAVRSKIAKQYGLNKTSDLAAVADQLTFGGNPDYIERADGFPALCDVYGLNFKKVLDIDIGLKYQALAAGDIDVTNAFTTDAQLGNDSSGLVTLTDDLQLQVNYLCSTVVRQDTLKRCPDLEETLLKMDGILSDKEMAHLNYQVEVEGQDEQDVARMFLIDKGLLGE